MDRISVLLRTETRRQADHNSLVCHKENWKRWRAYLNEWVDYSNVRTGIKHFVEVGLSVDKFELVELLIVLEKKNHATSQVRPSFGHLWKVYFTVTTVTHKEPINFLETQSTVHYVIMYMNMNHLFFYPLRRLYINPFLAELWISMQRFSIFLTLMWSVQLNNTDPVSILDQINWPR